MDNFIVFMLLLAYLIIAAFAAIFIYHIVVGDSEEPQATYQTTPPMPDRNPLR